MILKKIWQKNRSFIVASPIFIWQSLFFYVPIIFVVLLSFAGFTIYYYKYFINYNYFFIILKSLLLATVTSLLSFFIGYPVAHFLSFKAGKYKTLFLFLLILPFWTNFLLHIYAWFFVLERGGFLNNLLLHLGIINSPLHLLNNIYAIVALMVYSYLPFMVLPIYSVLEKFDKKLLEASSDLGASFWQTTKKILLPLSFSGIQSGFFLVFVPSFAEFVIPGIVGGEKFVFAGTVISQYILGNRTISLGAAFTILSCLALILFILFAGFLSKRVVKDE